MSTKDYFSSATVANGDDAPIPPTPSIPNEIPGSHEPAKESSFMGRLKSFGVKKHVQKSEKDDVTSPPTTNGAPEKDENADKTEGEETNGNAPKEKPYTFADVLLSIRKTYENALFPTETVTEKSDTSSMSSISRIPVLEEGRLRTAITPSMPDDTPPIRPSQDTIIIIAEQRVSVDGSMDLYRGTVASVGDDVDLLEEIAPGWLGELLLLVLQSLVVTDEQDKLPKKEIVKISFTLKPHLSSKLPDMLAGLFSSGSQSNSSNSRLNANRMLRARKIIAYVAERIESDLIPETDKDKPDTWLELLCQEKVFTVYFYANVDCSSEVDVADDSDANVETRWRCSVHLSIEVGEK